ncbi:MAG: dTDP-4-dehydrorhamnose 3,5-epimerase family protein [Nitrospirota bacterium]
MENIEGVEIKELKHIPDERGFLMEMLRSDDKLFAGFGQVYITGCRRGYAKGWHYHKEQTDHFVCVSGKALVVLYDSRKDSPTYKKVQEFILDAPPCKDKRPILLRIPVLVMHGFTAIECEEARIINIPTLPYKYKEPDEYRYPWNSREIPYKWPDSIVKGG